MCHRGGIPHDPPATFDQDTVLSVNPDDLCKFFCHLAYGKEQPEPADLPTSARSSTLEFYKKAISSFMPRRLKVWDEIHQEGNPTRSQQVNALIKTVRKFEVRQQGVKSAARRPLEYDEFLNLLTFLRKGNDALRSQRLVATLAIQWQLIGRIDDMLKLKYANFSFDFQHEFAVLVRLTWSKNITEEREAPQQQLLGSMDERLCPILNLAIYVELQAAAAAKLDSEGFVFEAHDGGCRAVRSALQKAFGLDTFERLKSGPVGTHSVRKGAATYGSRNGLAKDYIQRRGRWRHGSGVVDRYIDPTLPYPDAVAASVLAGPSGPAKYRHKPDAAFLTDALLAESIAPGIAAVLGRQMAKTLGLAIVWAAFASSGHVAAVLPSALKAKTIEAIQSAGGPDGTNADHNPVERIPIHVSGDGGMVTFTELGNVADGIDLNSNGEAVSSSAIREIVCVQAQMGNLKRRIEELHAGIHGEVGRLRSDMFSRLDAMHRAIKRIAIQPVVRPASYHPSTRLSEAAAVKLPKCPRDLYILWQEYEFGRCGIKPAKHFTAAERGMNKAAYSRRKTFWDAVERMVLRGHSSDSAIDKVYEVYGRRCSVTNVLVRMHADRARGGHPELQ